MLRSSIAAVVNLRRTHGFTEVARIPQYYGPADDKIVFWKDLTETS